MEKHLTQFNKHPSLSLLLIYSETILLNLKAKILLN